MKIVEVAAGLVFRDGNLLITQRYPGVHLGGMWEFPGGKREPHETFAECLHRELLEELGIEVEVREELEALTHEYPEKTVLLRFFCCTWRRNEPQTLGCPAFRWVRREDLALYEFPAADARLLRKLADSPELWK